MEGARGGRPGERGRAGRGRCLPGGPCGGGRRLDGPGAPGIRAVRERHPLRRRRLRSRHHAGAGGPREGSEPRLRSGFPRRFSRDLLRASCPRLHRELGRGPPRGRRRSAGLGYGRDPGDQCHDAAGGRASTVGGDLRRNRDVPDRIPASPRAAEALALPRLRAAAGSRSSCRPVASQCRTGPASATRTDLPPGASEARGRAAPDVRFRD